MANKHEDMLKFTDENAKFYSASKPKQKLRLIKSVT